MLDQMHFNGVWRDYQQRVLSEVATHLDDDRLHIVAAPGSGKTVLGLELIRRLGRKAILLNPTLTIRNQWAARLVPLFMDTAPTGDFLSYDLEQPGQITSSTYQSLHALWADEDQTRFVALQQWCADNGPLTIVVDEAHHLRRAWWKALQTFTDALDDVQIIALTATPPYDASPAEWARYEAMCGPADLEIGIPELVRCGDLCPHQDNVVLSKLSEDALQLLSRRRWGLAGIVRDMHDDEALFTAVTEHPWMLEPEQHEEAILDRPDVLSAMLVFIGMTGEDLPEAPLELLGARAKDIPPQSTPWTEILLNALLIEKKAEFSYPKEKAQTLYRRLHALGLVEGKRIRLGETQRIFRLMANDYSKLDAIAEIATREAASLGNDLRMVVLADHVREADLPKTADAPFSPAKLGVGPIFEKLRRATGETLSLAVLTGSLVIIPRNIGETLRSYLDEAEIDQKLLAIRPLGWCDTHMRVEASGAARMHIVECITRLLCDGHITALVGTQALLGEGWDAPAINSLVLASNSASYMLSNQMRGRAIRIDPNTPDKVSNIWHIATVQDLEANSVDAFADFLDWGNVIAGRRVGCDLALLSRRFKAFAGVARGSSHRIENGIERVQPLEHLTIDDANADSFAHAADRKAIAEKWTTSLGFAEKRIGGLSQRQSAVPSHTPRNLTWSYTLDALAVGALGSAGMAMGWQIAQSWGVIGYAVMAGGATAALPKLLKAGALIARNGSLENNLHQVGSTLLDGLHHAGVISDAEFAGAVVEIGHAANGSRDISFRGLSTQAENTVLAAFQDILGPVRNPRYVLVRYSKFSIRRRADYHAVPTIIGQRKEWATYFAERWNHNIGPSELVFTRNRDGRRLLLKGRSASFAAGMQRRVERSSAWV